MDFTKSFIHSIKTLFQPSNPSIKREKWTVVSNLNNVLSYLMDSSSNIDSTPSGASPSSTLDRKIQNNIGNLTASLRTRRISAAHRSSHPILPILEDAAANRPSNAVWTAKYTPLTFLPKTIFFIFTRFANLFFLLVVTLQTFPIISDSNGSPTYLTPLATVNIVFMIKEALEDSVRHKSDKRENNEITHLCKRNAVIPVTWSSLSVGDVVKVYAGEYFPADLLLLETSDAHGTCNVETKNLDGEANLKHKFCIPEIAKLFQDERMAGRICISASCETPRSDLFSFSGTAEVPTLRMNHTEATMVPYFWAGSKASDGTSREKRETIKVDLGIHQLLLRGSSLVNTKWCLGCVIYAGHSTRIFMNANTKMRQKWSRMEKMFNHHVIALVLLLLALCIFTSVAHLLHESKVPAWYLRNSASLAYTITVPSSAQKFLITFGRMFILLAQFIPLELFMFWEILRFVQALYIKYDREMYYGANPTSCATANTSRLVEELGNVTHVFSDKTGTLTQNKMKLQCLCVGTDMFGLDKWNYSRSQQEATGEIGVESFKNSIHSAINMSSEILRRPSVLHPSESLHASSPPCGLRDTPENVSLNRTEVMEVLLRGSEEERRQTKFSLMVLGLCHSVLTDDTSVVSEEKGLSPEHGDRQDGPDDMFVESLAVTMRRLPPTIANYVASSPDELTLVSGATSLGFEFCRRPNMNTIEVLLTSDFACSIVFGDGWFKSYTEWRDGRTYEGLMESFDESDVAGPINKANANCWVPVIKYKILDVLDFDNDRKRMSVVIQDPDGLIVMLTKGADEAIVPAAEASQTDVIELMNGYLSCMAKSGLRTLMMSYREMSESEYIDFNRKITEVRGLNEQSVRYSNMARLYATVETNLKILGCTGIEDKLQKNVSGTIQNLRDASIKVWMLTGDKVETAINIGYSTNLLSVDAFNAVLDGKTFIELRKQLMKYESYLKAAALLASESDQNWWNEIRWEKIHEDDHGDMNIHKDMEVHMNRRDSNAAKSTMCTPRAIIGNLNRSFSENALNHSQWGKVELSQRSSSPMKEHTTINQDGMLMLKSFESSHELDPRDNRGLQLKVDERSRKTGSAMVALQQGRSRMVSRAEIKEVLSGRPYSKSTRPSYSPRLSRSFSLRQNDHSELGGSKRRYSVDPFASTKENKMNMIESLLRLPTRRTAFSTVGPVGSQLMVAGYDDYENAPVIKGYSEFCITIPSQSLVLILGHPQLRARFFQLARHADTVIASRVSPKQKALLVQHHRAFNPRSVSLAIGDGANDVGMILAAHVGVGVAGKEGLQAMRAADFTIGEFDHLRSLLFLHGTSTLRKNSIVMYILIFKCVSFSAAEVIFAFFSGYSGVDIYNPLIKQFYTILFIGIPLLAYGMFDQTLPSSILARCPLFYMNPPTSLWPFGGSQNRNKILQTARYYCKSAYSCIEDCIYSIVRGNSRNHNGDGRSDLEKTPSLRSENLSNIPLRRYQKFGFVKRIQMSRISRILYPTSPVMWFGPEMLCVWLLFAFYTATIQVIVLLFGTSTAHVSTGGSGQINIDLNSYGQIVFFHNVALTNTLVALLSNSIYTFTPILLFLSILLFIALWAIPSSIQAIMSVPGADTLFDSFQVVSRTNSFYLSILLSMSINMLPFLILMSIHTIKIPTVTQVVMERVKKGVHDVVIGKVRGKMPAVLTPVPSPDSAYKGFAFQYDGSTKEHKSAFEAIIGSRLWESMRLKGYTTK